MIVQEQVYVGEIKFSGDTIFKGSTHWTKVEMEFLWKRIIVLCWSFCWVKKGRAKGEVYFDKLKNLSRSVKSYIISGENEMVNNDEGNQERIKIVEADIQILKNKLEVPEESAGVYKFSLSKK